MKLTMLGTGHAMVTRCYNTCFVLSDGAENFLVDGGGGNGLLRQMELAGIDPMSVSDIFVTHRHTDHIVGIFWMLGLYSRGGRPGMPPMRKLNIYSHDEVISILQTVSEALFRGPEAEAVRAQVNFITVADGETREILGKPVTFFDIHAAKAKQFGFTMDIGGGEKLTFCGDEPYTEFERPYAENSKWLLHEAFCLEAEADIYHPKRISHSSVKDAAAIAESLGVKNLLLLHTEDQHLADRRRLYTEEGRQYFSGGLFVPDDLETIEL